MEVTSLPSQSEKLEGEAYELQELYQTLTQSAKAEILGSVIAKTACGLPIKIVVLSTDLTLDANEIILIYACVGVLKPSLNLPNRI
jgi:hypothetical protein